MIFAATLSRQGTFAYPSPTLTIAFHISFERWGSSCSGCWFHSCGEVRGVVPPAETKCRADARRWTNVRSASSARSTPLSSRKRRNLNNEPSGTEVEVREDKRSALAVSPVTLTPANTMIAMFASAAGWSRWRRIRPTAFPTANRPAGACLCPQGSRDARGLDLARE